MSAGRKVTVLLTQAEAEGLLRLANAGLLHGIPGDTPTERKAAARGFDKFQHQFYSVKGRRSHGRG